MDKKPKTIILIDGNALIHRAFHALPPLTTKKGELVNAVYGFTVTLLSVLEKFKPEYIAASFDLAGPTFRHVKYEQYKATRVKAPDELYTQIPRVKELTRAFGIPIYEQEGYEADDCVGTLARQAVAADPHLDVVIVTGDNDALQLVNDRVKIFTLRKGIKDTVLYDTPAVVAKYGLQPEQLKDFKGLRGDASDNIPGVKGIGEKGAVVLLAQYGTLKGVYRHLSEIKGALHDKLSAGKESALLSMELGTIDTGAPVVLDLQQALVDGFDRAKAVELLRELEFFSLVKRLPGSDKEPSFAQAPAGKQGTLLRQGSGGQAKNKVVLKKAAEIEKFLKQCEEVGSVAVALDVERDTLFGGGVKGVALTLSLEKARSKENLQSVYIAFTPEIKPLLKSFFENSKIEKTFYDAKLAMKQLEDEKIEVAGLEFDVMLAAYLLNAGGNVTLSTLILTELGIESPFVPADTPSFAEATAGKQALMAEHIGVLRQAYTAKLEMISREQKREHTLWNVFQNIEMPLIPVLCRMEAAGIRLNVGMLKDLSLSLEEAIKKLEQEIYMFAGKEFNLNSPRQLADVLFVDLKISTDDIKKLKTGYSTASTELAKLRDYYPIVAKVEEYRELFKMKTTYLDVLPKLVDKDGRLHTTFHQTVAATGRLSSSDPNLQNIPIRNSWGEKMRKAFEAEKGHRLVGADYSQIELRIAAHLSGDETMLAAFQAGEDIHTTTAALVHKIDPPNVTPQLRRLAKALNFGIIYGMSAFGLAQAAGMSQEEAAKFIREYLKKFSGINRYMEETKAFARTNGYVETELGRRRYLPEINHPSVQIARAAERMAINMPVQGLAADITKLAMLAADKLIAEKFSDSVRMLLQVHDELIFEVKEKAAQEFSHAIKETMESVYTLKAPLVAEVSTGKNWGEI